jgi:hypothetical protein
MPWFYTAHCCNRGVESGLTEGNGKAISDVSARWRISHQIKPYPCINFRYGGKVNLTFHKHYETNQSLELLDSLVQIDYYAWLGRHSEVHNMCYSDLVTISPSFKGMASVLRKYT